MLFEWVKIHPSRRIQLEWWIFLLAMVKKFPIFLEGSESKAVFVHVKMCLKMSGKFDQKAHRGLKGCIQYDSWWDGHTTWAVGRWNYRYFQASESQFTWYK